MTVISNDAVRSFIHYLTILGLKRQECFQQLNTDEKSFNLTASTSALAYQNLYQFAVKTTNNNKLGFEFGQLIEAHRWGVLGNIAFSCETLEQVLHAQHKYQAIVGSIGTPIFKRLPNLIQLQWLPSGIDNCHLIEEVITGWIALSRQLTCSNINPIEVHFCHNLQSRNIKDFESFYNSPVYFGSSYNGIIVDKSVLALRCYRHDPALNRALKQYADEQLKVRANSHPVEVCLSYIEHTMPYEVPTISAFAEQLNKSERTVQRQLKQSKVNFSDLLTRCRKQKSLDYLESSKLSVQEISHLLAFSEPSAFIRAFKTWYGKVPTDIRKQK